MKKLIEGLIIVGIAALVIVLALFGTTIMSTLGAIGTSITAMITSAATGAANLLSAWYYWAIATDVTSYYIGWLWLGAWLTMFAYCGYKIATSDKKKWMNLVGKGSNYVGVILILFLVIQPIAISWGATYFADTTMYSEVDYNVTIQVGGTTNEVYGGLTNATTTYWSSSQTMLYDNDTKESIVAAWDYPTVASPTKGQIKHELNSTFLATKYITKIEIDYTYVGTGNFTGLTLYNDAATVTYAEWDNDDIISDSNGTLTVLLEPFTSNQLKSADELLLYIKFWDSSNLPQDNDYSSFAVHFYETATIMNEETLMFWLAVAITLVDVLGILWATGILEKYIL